MIVVHQVFGASRVNTRARPVLCTFLERLVALDTRALELNLVVRNDLLPLGVLSTEHGGGGADSCTGDDRRLRHGRRLTVGGGLRHLLAILVELVLDELTRPVRLVAA